MLVYGDPQFDPASFIARLQERIQAAHSTTVEHIRAALARAGQLEQAIADSECQSVAGGSQLREQLHGCIADALVAAWKSSTLEINGGQVASCLERAIRSLQLLQGLSATSLRFKVPEGFEFYTLLPEQYCVAASTWAEAHENNWPRQALVVGIRSIGTTLSAVVATVLRRRRWEVRRITVRPSGHPYSRQVTLLPEIAHVPTPHS